MQQKYGKCIQCNNERPINSRSICSECIFKNNHKGKTRLEVYLEKSNERNQRQVNKRKTQYKPKKPTGERELFIEIWSERSHYCENPKCRKWLGNEPKVIFFSHRKSKGAYPELRLDKTNIDLLCSECHYQEDFGEKINWES